jgi:TPR repeat protein
MSNSIQALLKLAEQNDADAQYELAEAYRTGSDVAENYTEALRWYRAAAELGLADAQNNLGAMYLAGMGTEKNPIDAAYWYQKAAEQKQVHAQFNLAMLYMHGNGVAQNDTEAAHWLHAAAEQGDLEAVCQLGDFYQLGRAVEQNIVTAADLHTIAAIEGHLTSIDKLSEYQEEIESAALSGSIVAALCMAKKYDHGLGTDPDTAQVYAWLQWAKLHGTHDEDEDELNEWESYVSAITREADIERGKKLLNEMRGRADEMI